MKRGISVEKYKLSDHLNEKIVDGLIKGFQEYIEVRMEKDGDIRLSGTYDLVKGKYIDAKVVESCSSENMGFSLVRAKDSWEYLQYRQEEDKVLMVIRSAGYSNEDEAKKGKTVDGKRESIKRRYIGDLVSINSEIDFNQVTKQTTSSFKTIQLELADLFVDAEESWAIAQLKDEFQRFYMITYMIDETHNISKVSLCMPNPFNNKAYLIEDLTAYIKPDQTIEVDDETSDILIENARSQNYGYDFEVMME